MTEIKRFVSYIYMYNNGVKESNVGFAKVDSRNGQCKIAVNIKGLEQSNGKCEKVYLFYRKQEEIVGIYIGSFQIINGIGEFHEQFQAENIKATNLSLDEMNGIFVREEDGNQRVFASGWDDYAIVVNQFCIHSNEMGKIVSDKGNKGLLHASEVEKQRKDPVIFFDRNWREETVATEQIEEEEEKIAAEEEKAETSVLLDIQEVEEVEKLEQTMQTESDVHHELERDYEQKTEKEKEDFERGVKRGQKMDTLQKEGTEQNSDVQGKKRKEQNRGEQKEQQDADFLQEVSEGEQKSEFMRQAEGVETVIFESVDGERTVSNIHSRAEADKAEENKQNCTENIQENGLLWGVPVPGIWKEMSWEEYQKKEQHVKEQVQRCREQNRNQQEMTPSEQVQQTRIQQGMNQPRQVQQKRMQPGINQARQVQQVQMQPGINQARQVQQVQMQPEINQTRQVQQVQMQPEINQTKQVQQVQMQPEINQAKQVQQDQMQPNRVEVRMYQTGQMQQDHMEQNMDWLDQEQSNEFQQDITGWMELGQSEGEWQNESLGDWEKENIELETQMPDGMQNLEETMWDKLCHQFPKIRAFVDEPESLCLKIDLRDLRILPKENWVLGNNSFLLHGYYNFRYLILTQEKEGFVLGIPGIYHPNEKMMASMFGFGDFKPVKVCEKMLGQFGYWCKGVTL